MKSSQKEEVLTIYFWVPRSAWKNPELISNIRQVRILIEDYCGKRNIPLRIDYLPRYDEDPPSS